MYSEKRLVAAILFSMVLGCGKKGSSPDPTPEPPATEAKVSYTADLTDFANPERGFYRYSETNAQSFSALNVNILKGYRGEQSISTATYKVLSTLVFRYYVLTGFNNAPLSQALLDNIAADFAVAREAGVKLIPRFTYTITTTAGNCPEGSICNPYGDASKAVVLNHIAQLKPILTANADVIACLQMGFIGIWGENYYTDNFGDASSNGNGKLLDQNWLDRTEVLQALLDALPKDRMVQVRIPQFKQRYAYGVNAPTSSAALTDAEGFSESDKARVAFHNDCFLSGPDDYGTFSDYGNSSTPRAGDNATTSAMRNYQKADSKYVAVGGETCDDTYSPENDCEAAGRAETEMKELHYSFLNAHYNTAVNNDWQSGGCMASIKNKLGYRFVLKDGTYTKTAAPGGKLKVSINLDNIGYASPFNPRPVKLLLRNKTSGNITSFDVTTDIRKWFTGTVALSQSFTLPASITPGQYDLILFMPDKYAAISARPEFAIRLANAGVWEAATGYNVLNHVVTVQ